MADRRIIFSASMIAALLAGRKTQTRQILKPQPDARTTDVSVCRDVWMGCGLSSSGSGISQRDRWQKLPYAVGDRLWAKETWSYWPAENPTCERDNVIYRATDDDWECRMFDWRPSIHMPRWASRLTLLVTDVRVERLNDISQADVSAEGITQRDGAPIAGAVAGWHEPFALLWNGINGPDAWAANPWVVVVGFSVHTTNIDQIAPTDAHDIAGAA